MAFLLGIIILVIGLIISIGLHECGHLLPAKKFGALVPQFMIGFGPTLFSRKHGETEYGVKAFLLGGYCRILGMYGPGDPDQFGYKLDGKKLSVRQARALDAEQAEDLVPTWSQEARDASLSEIPLSQRQRAFYNLPVSRRLVVMFGGPVMNLFLSFVLMGIAMLGIGIATPTTTVDKAVCLKSGQVVDCAQEGAQPSPGAKAGIKPGDKLLAWDGKIINTWEDLRKYAGATHGDATVSVQRGGEVLDLQLSGVEGKAGLYARSVRQSTGLATYGQTMWQMFYQTGAVVLKLPVAVWDVGVAVFTDTPRDSSGIMSVLGVGRIAGEIGAAPATQITFADRAGGMLSLLASLNMALFVFNLIPLPPLDGGHIAGACWQGIKNSYARLRSRPAPGPIDAAKAVPLTYVVAGLLIAMTVLLMVADIVDPIRLP
ncbi:MAG: site-2 protease family protein [Varibaculum cambriense]|nr:site-2 protease family protein [Varibaculum cambriense]